MTVSEIAEEIRNRTAINITMPEKILLGKILTKYGFLYGTSKNMRRYEVYTSGGGECEEESVVSVI